jgi:hypothetical protein
LHGDSFTFTLSPERNPYGMSHHFETTLEIRSISDAVYKRFVGGLLCYKVVLYEYVHVGVKWFGSDLCLGSLHETG